MNDPAAPVTAAQARSSMMQNPAQILVLSPSNLRTDPRVRRRLKLLCEPFRVTAAGYADPELSGVEFVSIAGGRKTIRQRLARISRLATKRFERHYENLAFVPVEKPRA